MGAMSAMQAKSMPTLQSIRAQGFKSSRAQEFRRFKVSATCAMRRLNTGSFSCINWHYLQSVPGLLASLSLEVGRGLEAVASGLVSPDHFRRFPSSGFWPGPETGASASKGTLQHPLGGAQKVDEGRRQVRQMVQAARQQGAPREVAAPSRTAGLA